MKHATDPAVGPPLQSST